MCFCVFVKEEQESFNTYRVWHYIVDYATFLKLCICNFPITARCGSGDKPGHHQGARERPEEAVPPFTRGPGPIQIRRLPGWHLRGHSASCCVSYLWRQSPWDHWGTEEESCYCCACGAQKVRSRSLCFCITSDSIIGFSDRNSKSEILFVNIS